MHTHSDHELLLSAAAAVAPAAAARWLIPSAIELARGLICGLSSRDFRCHEPSPGWDVYAARLPEVDFDCLVRLAIYEYEKMPKLILARLGPLA